MLKKQTICILLASLSLGSCNFLDYDESEGLEKEVAYGYFENVTKLASAVYRELPDDYGTIGGALRESATDNAVFTWTNNAVYKMYNNAWSPINLVDDKWGTYYNVIHDANSFLENYSEENLERHKWHVDYSDNIKKVEMSINEVHVLRAFYHFELAKRYGDIPLVLKTYTLDEVNKIEKKDFQDVINFVADECLAYSEKLPLDHADFYGETGRINKGTALAIRSRALLYAASPLFAGEGDVSSKWEAAAKAAYDVIKLNKYSLPKIKKDPLYDKEGGNLVLESPQMIYAIENGESNTFEAWNIPAGMEGAKGGNTPTQNLVDEYEMVEDGSSFDWTNSEHVANMYFDKDGKPTRDPRLYLNVVCDGMEFMKQKIEPLEGGINGYPLDGATLTGYYLKKLMNENVSLKPAPNNIKKYHHYPLFRYAEILLNYAEAMNEWKGPDYVDAECPMSARQAINLVRASAGMKAIDVAGPDEFRERVRKERRIELAFEDHRFWDIRRWMIGDVVKEIYGVKKENDVYKKHLVQNRVWDKKMYLYPIPQNEVFVNPNLVQNPGWEVTK